MLNQDDLEEQVTAILSGDRYLRVLLDMLKLSGRQWTLEETEEFTDLYAKACQAAFRDGAIYGLRVLSAVAEEMMEDDEE